MTLRKVFYFNALQRQQYFIYLGYCYIFLTILRMLQNLTEREKICITFAALQDLQGLKISWPDLFMISRNKAIDIVSKSRTPSQASTWKNSAAVQNYFNEVLEALHEFLDSQKTKAINEYLIKNLETGKEGENRENGMTNNEAGGCVGKNRGSMFNDLKDFTEKSNMLQALNEIAGTATDPKDKLNAFKQISDLQGFKETTGDKDEEIKRYYMPLRCSNCELYKAKSVELQQD